MFKLKYLCNKYYLRFGSFYFSLKLNRESYLMANKHLMLDCNVVRKDIDRCSGDWCYSSHLSLCFHCWGLGSESCGAK